MAADVPSRTNASAVADRFVVTSCSLSADVDLGAGVRADLVTGIGRDREDRRLGSFDEGGRRNGVRVTMTKV